MNTALQRRIRSSIAGLETDGIVTKTMLLSKDEMRKLRAERRLHDKREKNKALRRAQAAKSRARVKAVEEASKLLDASKAESVQWHEAERKKERQGRELAVRVVAMAVRGPHASDASNGHRRPLDHRLKERLLARLCLSLLLGAFLPCRAYLLRLGVKPASLA